MTDGGVRYTSNVIYVFTSYTGKGTGGLTAPCFYLYASLNALPYSAKVNKSSTLAPSAGLPSRNKNSDAAFLRMSEGSLR